MATFSHSALKDFEQCPRKYHEVRVLKKFPFEETEAILYGNALHEATECYVRDGTPLPEQFTFMKAPADVLLARPGRKFAEQKMALTAALHPCDWWAKDVWVRGAADLLIIDDDNLTAWVVDWKTGGNRYPDTDQLKLMSLMVFAHHPHVRKVNSALVFVVKDAINTMSMTHEEVEAGWWDYRERVARIDAAHENGVWNPKQSGLCRKWCPVRDCEFNGQR